MRFTKAVAAFAMLAGLTACEQGGSENASGPGSRTVAPGVEVRGPSGDETVTVAGADGSTVIHSGAAAEAAVDRSGPAFTQPYPGARVTQSVEAPNDAGRMIVFTTPENPDTVIAYYRERAEEAGLTSGASMTMGETRMYGADASNGGSLAVMVAPSDGQSQVTVTWSGQG